MREFDFEAAYRRSERSDGHAADEMIAKRMHHHHTPVRYLPHGCPLTKKKEFRQCISCDYTSRIGFCAHPIKINEEILAGRARPMEDFDLR